MGRGRGPRKSPGAPAYTLGPELWRENEDASPPALRPVKPLCWRYLQSLPRTLCLLPKPLDPENSPPSRCLSRRSPLRSIGCTAAPEGQTKFGFGKRASGVILEISGRCTDCGKPPQSSVPGGRPPSTRRTYAVGGVRAVIPSKAEAWEARKPLEEKGSRKLNLPRPKSQRPDPGEPPHPGAAHQVPKQPVATREAVGAQRRKEASLIVNLRGATLGVLGSIFLSLFFYSPNPISPTSLNERVRENATIRSL